MDEKLKGDLLMFFSFVLLSGFVYVFHIIQSAGQIRGYVTSLALLIGWFVMKGRENDKRLTNLWGSFLVWLIHSNVFFDVRTHFTGIFRFVKHILFCVLVLYLQITRGSGETDTLQTRRLSSFRNVAVILLFVSIALLPDLSTNAYGNALFSILRVFCVAVLVMTRFKDAYKKNTSSALPSKLILYDFVWIFFIHEFGLALAILQLLGDVTSLHFTSSFPYFKFLNKYELPETAPKKSSPQGKRTDVISMSDSELQRLFKR